MSVPMGVPGPTLVKRSLFSTLNMVGSSSVMASQNGLIPVHNTPISDDDTHTSSGSFCGYRFADVPLEVCQYFRVHAFDFSQIAVGEQAIFFRGCRCDTHLCQ